MTQALFRSALEAHRRGDLAAAVAGYREVLARVDSDNAWANLGLALSHLGRAEEAEAAFARAIARAPATPEHRYNLANHLRRTGRLTEALAEYAAAHSAKPAIPGLARNYGDALLAAGDFARGWALYDERPERLQSEARRLAFPEWRGEPLAGKRLFVWTEQGYGDQILAARFLPRLEAAQTTLVTVPALARLIAGLFAGLGVRVVPREPQTSVAPHDYWTLPLSIPRWRDGPLWTGPYLSAEPRTPGQGGVGVVWRGNALPDPGRSIPEELGRRLLDLPGAVSLHPEDSGAADFADTAAIIAGLDAVVSIDTSVAHLAGAMGKPVFVLLQAQAQDWRWTQPWYPTATLVRQPAPGDWAGALAEVGRRLAGAAAAHARGAP
ncbi:glycosyltransferase family 9 protein [Phenylobacterium soli]|uniref:glycosyltransferase family 9 protein n=1 Tax=Phenylobacterium soli TaxID=2170551 RepID=UPI001057EDB4|nr:tetratricopeptide repeat protein [Phenylobacterium soli]